jgi:hypothetical protein
MPPQIQTPLEVGIRFIETFWYSYACRIVDKAIEVYKIDDEKAAELKSKFLKRGDYEVIQKTLVIDS